MRSVVRLTPLLASVGVVIVTLGAVRSFLSKAPMLQMTVPSLSPSFLSTPRWSRSGQAVLLAASTAGLPGRRARVSVGPPLSWRGPSRGLVFCLSPGLVKGQLSSELMLLPCEEITPANCAALQFSIELPATIVFFTKTAAPSWVMIPPPNRADLLFAMVEFSMFIVVLASRAAEQTPPLNWAALLPLIVVFVMLAVPPSWRTPA
jgi:hypothetical protein